MDPEIKKRLDDQDELLGKIYASTEKTRKYFLWALVITVGAIIIPLIGLAVVVPWAISSYSSALGL